MFCGKSDLVNWPKCHLVAIKASLPGHFFPQKNVLHFDTEFSKSLTFIVNLKDYSKISTKKKIGKETKLY